ncbi:MAG: hypothetical protein HZA25_01310 [Candidatus Niyogibacteria bacterium]|nr:hypothetical protein [Candidatus Niyogibacteria bacterium]
MNERFSTGNFEEIDRAIVVRKAIAASKSELANIPEPLPEDFIGLTDINGKTLYTERSVAADNAEVARLEREFRADEERDLKRKETSEYATAFETLLMIQTELCEWLGPEAMTVRTSKFDDIKNGVDFMIRFPDGPDIAVDVTASFDQLPKKFNRVKREIDQGRLADLKYFYDEMTDERGPLKDIPRVVVAADGRTIGGLSELWLVKDKKRSKTTVSRCRSWKRSRSNCAPSRNIPRSPRDQRSPPNIPRP